MGSCWSCLYKDSVPDNHPTKFKVTNVDDEGNELGSGTMELTQTELVLHTRKRDAVRWPYLCLRRYGYDSNLFSFESGRRCQTGQGIFAFKCPRAEEIFTLLQELMQCNSINVVEEPVMMGRPGHPPELDIPRTPQTPNTPAYTVQGFPNGYPGYPISADSSHASSRHPSLLSRTHDTTHTYVNTASVEGEVRGRHCVHSLPEVRPSTFAETGGSHPGMHCCPHEEHGDPQVFLQTTSQEAKFRLGPTPAQRRMLDRERQPSSPTRTSTVCAGLRAAVGAASTRVLAASRIRGGPAAAAAGGEGHPLHLSQGHAHGPASLPSQGYGCERVAGGAHRKTALLNYENLPSLPPVWEYCFSEGPGTPNGYHQDGGHAMRNYVNTERMALGPPRQPHCSVGIDYGCDYRRGGSRGGGGARGGCEHGHGAPSRQLNYIQVELDGEPGREPVGGGGAQQPLQHQMPPSGPRRSEFYAVIDLKKTAAMSNLQRALPRDDGTARKTRHNSTDLPL
uniref:Fibroblast growth factor receptor substrate 3 n=1 Tax=Scleropages formosus TaxID=113540 RepID=A0A8C9W7D4_SCLFO